MEALEGRNRDKDDNSLLAVANFDLIKIQKSARELQDKTLDRFLFNPTACAREGSSRWEDGLDDQESAALGSRIEVYGYREAWFGEGSTGWSMEPASLLVSTVPRRSSPFPIICNLCSHLERRHMSR